MEPADAQRAWFYVGSLWAMAVIAVVMIFTGFETDRQIELGLSLLPWIGGILWLVTWRDRGGHWLLIPFVIMVAFSEGGWTAAGLPVSSHPGVMLVVAWSATIFVVGERLRRIGWFAP